MRAASIILAFVSIASAAVLKREGVCAAGSANCCTVNVDGVAALECEYENSSTTVEELYATCAASGTTAYCCTLVVDGDGILCNPA